MAVGRIFLLAGLVTSLSSVAPAVPVPSTSQWVLDYGETQCSAVKKYGQGGDQLTLAIRPAPFGDTYEFVLGRNRSGPDSALGLKGSIDFGGGPIEAWLLRYGGKGDNGEKVDAYAFRIRAAEIESARTAKAVTFHVSGGPDASLELDNMGPLLAGLQKCTEDLKRYWNFDGAKTGAIASPPKGDVRRAFTAQDYPDEAVWRGQEGAAQFLLLIDERGRVARCHVVIPSGVPLLDAMGCQVMRERVKMKPARDPRGHAVRSTYFTPPVNWRMATSS